MGFHVKISDLRSLRSYEDAKRRHDSIIPIRGKSPELRPLGDRYAYAKTIHESVQDGVSYIACCLYESEVIKFFADGRIVISGCGYNTISTAKFIWKVAQPVLNASTWGRAALWVRLIDDKQYIINNKAPITINGDGTVEAEPCVIHKVKRKELNVVRKQYKPFIDYVVTMYKLTGGVVEFTRDYGTRVIDVPFSTLKNAPDLDTQAAWAAAIIATSFPRCLRAVRNKINDLIKTAHPEVFERVVLPLGQVKADYNINLVKQWSK